MKVMLPIWLFLVDRMDGENEMQTDKNGEVGDYSESDEEAKHPGAILGLIMGIYPAVLIAGILLLFSGIAIRNGYRYFFPDSHREQLGTSPPSNALRHEASSQNRTSK